MVTGLTQLTGGYSGETFLGEYAGQRAVVRIYAGRSAARGPRAPEIDAAVLAWIAPVLPVPRVLEVRPGEAAGDHPGLLITEHLPGQRLDLVWPTLDTAQQARVAATLGAALGALGHVVLPRRGIFEEPSLRLSPLPPEHADIPAYFEHSRDRIDWSEKDLERLERHVDDAQSQLDAAPHYPVLAHSDFNLKNLLVDPESLALTGVLDWEFAHAGSPWRDLGNLLRYLDDDAAERVLRTHAEHAPLALREVDLDDRRMLADAADLDALIDFATRADEHVEATRGAALLRRRIGRRDGRPD